MSACTPTSDHIVIAYYYSIVRRGTQLDARGAGGGAGACSIVFILSRRCGGEGTPTS
jgi:hypothetical protein